MSTPSPPKEIEDLLVRLDRALADGEYDHDIESMTRISIELCEQIRSRLDDEQRSAMEVAIRYWNDRSTNAMRLKYVERIGERRDAYIREGSKNSAEAQVNQLVWCALNTNTGLSAFAAEYLVDTAVGAGLSSTQIERSFQTVLPSLLQQSRS